MAKERECSIRHGTRVRIPALLFIIVMMFAMMFTMMPVMAFATEGTDAENYNLWIGNTQVTSENAGNVLGDNTVTYVPDKDNPTTKGTLTLNNATIENVNTEMYHGYTDHPSFIYSNGLDLTIELIGTNNVGDTTTDKAYSIICTKDLTIQGDGTLTVKGTYAAIYTTENTTLTISDGTVNATGTDGDAIDSYSMIISGGTVNAEATYDTINSNSLTVSGGTVNATSKGESFTAIKSRQGIITVSGGTIIATGGRKGISGTVKNSITGTGWTNTEGTEGKAKIDISTDGQDLSSYKKVQFPEVYDLWIGETQVTGANAGNVLGKFNAEEEPTVTYVPDEKDSTKGTLTLNDATITDTNNGISNYVCCIYSKIDNLTINLVGNNQVGDTNDKPYYAIYATNDSYDNDLTITGTGTLTAVGSGTAIISDSKLTISGGDITCEGAGSDDAWGIFTGNDITISGGKVNANGAFGIQTYGNIIISSGSITATSTGDHRVGIFCTFGNMIVRGGTVTATSTGQEGAGIYTNIMIVRDGTVDATATGDKGKGINSSNMTVIGGKVSAKAELKEDAGEEAKSGVGITTNIMTVSGGTINATSADDDGIFLSSDDIYVSGGTVTASGGEGKYGFNPFPSVGEEMQVLGGTASNPTAETTEPCRYMIVKKKPASAPVDPDEAAANTVIDMVNALPASGKITTTDKSAIEAARAAYNALTDEQKAKVSAATLEKLTDAEAALAAAVKAEAASKTKTVKNGDVVEISKSTYTITSVANGTVKFTNAKNAKKVTIPATVTYNGKKYAVTGIAAKAFKGKKTKTIVIKTKKLTKKSVKKSLKGSKVKKIKVKVGKKSVNKKYVKKYKKIFTKKNAGKKVKVR